MKPRPSLLVFADDWGRHPSSCQHLVRQLLPEHPVWWVNTIGMRRPSLDLSTLYRGLEKMRHWFAAGRTKSQLPPNLQVVSPRMWPWFGRAWDRRLNRRLLLNALGPVVRVMPQPVVALTTLPIVAGLIGSLPVVRWVYYCVDDFSVWPGLDHRAIDRMERELVGKVDSLIAVSETLRKRLKEFGRDSLLLTHGVELDTWRVPADGNGFGELADCPRPWIVFWGVIDRRMDVRFVERLAAEMTAGTVLLVGPEDNPDPALAATPRVRRLPPMKMEELARLAAAASVLIMPYDDLPVTRAMQPLKLKEYLATGRPVVVRDLPATRPWADCLDLASTPEAFAAAVLRRLNEGTPQEQQTNRRRLEAESWAAKADLLRQVLHAD